MISNKKIVLTGANSGIGLETLKLLAKDGNKILAVDLKDDKLKEFDKDIVIPFICDISTKENVDSLFDKAIEVLGDIDIFFANAGFPYYEKIDYSNWDRIDKIFKVNTYSPIYSYMKYVEYKNGREGQFAITISAMGQLGFPGYALYAGTKFAVEGFNQSIRYEIPSNIKLSTIYPVATDTGFFKKGAEGTNHEVKRKPFPVQKADKVAKVIYRGLDKKKRTINPCKLFTFSRVLFRICPLAKSIYMKNENSKLIDYLNSKSK